MKKFLFVYGSMKKGFVNDSRLDCANFIGEVKTIDKFVVYPSEHYLFPFMSKKESLYNIKGELYLVDEDYIKSTIDLFEGVADFCYIRELIQVVDSNGNLVEAEAYFKDELNHPLLSDESFALDEWKLEHENAGQKCLSFCSEVYE